MPLAKTWSSTPRDRQAEEAASNSQSGAGDALRIPVIRGETPPVVMMPAATTLSHVAVSRDRSFAVEFLGDARLNNHFSLAIDVLLINPTRAESDACQTDYEQRTGWE
ncbi:hypothetical protein [Jiella sp. M17.18]|uniref:hypothetical protein n=1 Tax=Jiella sp. M17.18 TaxID=3234247 RepID=UPI0034DE1729